MAIEPGSSHRTRTRRLVLGVACLSALCFGPGTYQLVRLTMLQHRLDRRLAALASQREQLEQEQARLKTDATYVEGLIRSTFKVARPGEYVIPIDRSSTRERSR